MYATICSHDIVIHVSHTHLAIQGLVDVSFNSSELKHVKRLHGVKEPGCNCG